MSMPLGSLQDCPLGISLIAPRGCDLGLLAFVAENFVGKNLT
jgi:Asp-tRNA(Asn)/Glu-tRNA(Gln) amidotransferase A subunit family amidase